MHKMIQPVLLLLLLCLTACHSPHPTDPTTTPGTHSPRYEVDSLRTFGRAHQLYDEQRDRDAIPYLDSIFLVPASLNPSAPPHPPRGTLLPARPLHL